MRLDLPTLERPAKATSGLAMGGSEASDPAAERKRHSPAKSRRPASISSAEKSPAAVIAHLRQFGGGRAVISPGKGRRRRTYTIARPVAAGQRARLAGRGGLQKECKKSPLPGCASGTRIRAPRCQSA